ncbi:hypothetical protein GCM10018980_63850 [Streptomyces capoamus]|uniref:Uncharacterized protein n=1 Tax=Streptomyces capoamus TaxID=68183 RepID=A0A919F1M7_9ACTN|nr:hypothetical protein [Streptomyces capoamus]GGW14630.1 hypothetical protein GCM10010501_23260 [Streptomyces libani subsp. rufus]GHG69571.1 hypothetical protein GCM10018980_63850 [Streptomyces capoamus]
MHHRTANRAPHRTRPRLLGAAVALATGTAALLGTGAGTAAASEKAHCDRAERPIWSEGPSRNVTARGCDIPDQRHRWYVIDIDTLVQPRHKNDYLDESLDGTTTLHDRTLRCLGYTRDARTVNWFGCVPDLS